MLFRQYFILNEASPIRRTGSCLKILIKVFSVSNCDGVVLDKTYLGKPPLRPQSYPFNIL